MIRGRAGLFLCALAISRVINFARSFARRAVRCCRALYVCAREAYYYDASFFICITRGFIVCAIFPSRLSRVIIQILRECFVSSVFFFFFFFFRAEIEVDD